MQRSANQMVQVIDELMRSGAQVRFGETAGESANGGGYRFEITKNGKTHTEDYELPDDAARDVVKSAANDPQVKSTMGFEPISVMDMYDKNRPRPMASSVMPAPEPSSDTSKTSLPTPSELSNEEPNILATQQSQLQAVMQQVQALQVGGLAHAPQNADTIIQTMHNFMGDDINRLVTFDQPLVIENNGTKVTFPAHMPMGVEPILRTIGDAVGMSEELSAETRAAAARYASSHPQPAPVAPATPEPATQTAPASTAPKLNRYGAPESDLPKGWETKENVTKLQETMAANPALKAIMATAAHPDGVDGMFGPKTLDALVKYAKARNIDITNLDLNDSSNPALNQLLAPQGTRAPAPQISSGFPPPQGAGDGADKPWSQLNPPGLPDPAAPAPEAEAALRTARENVKEYANANMRDGKGNIADIEEQYIVSKEGANTLITVDQKSSLSEQSHFSRLLAGADNVAELNGLLDQMKKSGVTHDGQDLAHSEPQAQREVGGQQAVAHIEQKQAQASAGVSS